MKLIIGASGAVGIPLIKQLVQRGEALRALSSSETSAERLRGLGVGEVIVGDYRGNGVVERAMDGVDGACYVPARFVADEFEVGKRIVDAAKGAALEHFLFCSAFHPQLHDLGHHWQKLQVEEYLVDSDLLHTVVQPSMFMQNIRVEWDRVVEQGVYPRPYSPDSKMSVVDTDDLAEAMANIMTERKFQGASYQLAGPGPISHAEMAAIISEELGRPVAAVHRDLSDWDPNGPPNAAGATTQSKTMSPCATITTSTASNTATLSPSPRSWAASRAITGISFADLRRDRTGASSRLDPPSIDDAKMVSGHVSESLLTKRCLEGYVIPPQFCRRLPASPAISVRARPTGPPNRWRKQLWRSTLSDCCRWARN